MPSIAWSTIRNAIAQWAESATSLPTHWEGQKAPAPSGSYISLKFTGEVRRGRDWLFYELDEDADPGEEIIHSAQGPRKFTLTVQAFTEGDAVGNTSAEAYLQDMKTALRFDSNTEAMRAVGISIIPGNVQNVGGTLNWSTFEPRAVMDCQVHTTATLTETSTYISNVEITDLSSGETITVSDT